jgi:hypothetical protein
MKRLGVVLLALVVVLGAFWIGLMLNFPGQAFSHYVERRVDSRQGFDLVLTPAELRWNRVSIARAELRRRDNSTAEPLFTITDFSVPVTWRLLRGLPVSGEIGKDGHLDAFLPWSAGGEAYLAGHVNLAGVTLPAVLRPISVGGTVDVQGHFVMDAQAQAGTRLPQGGLQVTGTDVTLNGFKLGTVELPPTRLEGLTVDLETGRTVNLRRVEFRGDLQGTADGAITPNLRDPRNSLLAVRVTTAFRDTWVARLGTLRPILESFLNHGRVVLSLSGTVGEPQLVPVRGAN